MQQESVIAKVKSLQEKIAEKEKKRSASGVAAAAYLVDQLLDSAIWVVDNYWNVPPEKN